MTKRDRELMVEGVLKRWRKLQEEVWAAEQDAANIAFSQGSGEPVQSSSISDKTARGASILEGIATKRLWIRAVEDGMKWLDQENADLARLLRGYYWTWNKGGYKRAHARMFKDWYCQEYHISHAEFHFRRLDALYEIAYYATEAGLFRSI